MREKLEVNPKPEWRGLFDTCSSCNNKVWVQEILCNAKEDFIFKVVCFRCGQVENYQLKAKDIAEQCFDLDFMALVGIKH